MEIRSQEVVKKLGIEVGKTTTINIFRKQKQFQEVNLIQVDVFFPVMEEPKRPLEVCTG